MLSKLTLIGIHNYSNGAIWDDIELPEGIEKELLINEILKQIKDEFLEEYKKGTIKREQITMTSIRKFQNSSMQEKNFNKFKKNGDNEKIYSGNN